MFEWDNKKRMLIEHKKLVKMQKEESERLEKQHKQEISYMKFSQPHIDQVVLNNAKIKNLNHSKFRVMSVKY